MPGHFTHIYTARRVADLLASGQFTDWPQSPLSTSNPVGHYDPKFCGQVMQEWEKFTAIGAIGPDLFYFSQDYNTKPIAPHSDQIMLALATYYFFDAAKEDDWEPLLIILDQINSTMAAIIRFIIKLQKLWQSFVAAWNKTIGPLVSAASEVLDDLTGGLISEFKVAVEQLKAGLIVIVEGELLTYHDIFNGFNTCVQKGWGEESFLWSDMSHYRRTSAMCQALVHQAEVLRTGTDGENRFRQFLAFAMGYMTHVGTDVIAHSFVNEQCGGPYRDHPQRHHLIENHIDSWNYSQSKAGGLIPNDKWGSSPTYPDLSMSALWFGVQLKPNDPHGKQRPDPLPTDPIDRKKALDVDGEMPLWMADSIVLAMKEAFEGHPHPQIFGGDAFQAQIDQTTLANIVQTVTGHGLDRPFQELHDDIAPTPSFPVPRGFPLPWEIRTMYKIMITFYKFSFNGTWELQKPRKPDFIILPPVSDFENLFQPPDFSGVDGSNPIEDVCGVFIALAEWAIKQLEAAVKLAGDLVKMAVSPSTYLLRLGLYELSMMVWDVTMKTHDVLAHTGFFTPHAEQRYDDGELRLPNEIDMPLITLGGSVDGAFRQALADAIDPMGNLDKQQDVIGTGHSIVDPNYPYYPVLRYHQEANGKISIEPWEYHRPWAYPNISLFTSDGKTNIETGTPTETYDPSKSDPNAPPGPFKPLRPGPYLAGTRPDHVFFRTTAPVDSEVRSEYERAQTPAQTDQLNAAHLIFTRLPTSPLGDPVPFSAYLIGQLTNHTGYATQFNLDSDRAYAYLTWDWIRGAVSDQSETNSVFQKPVVPPQGAPDWDWRTPLQLHYVDAPRVVATPVVTPPAGPR
jgi:hypothetical protein